MRIAQNRVPKGQFRVADMRSFSLGRKYDVVQRLFGSIGYLLTATDIVAALKCLSDHVSPGGVILVEPRLSPDAFRPGPRMLVVDRPELRICRMNVSERDDSDSGVSMLRFHYLIATSQGVRTAEECHRLSRVAPERMSISRERGCPADSIQSVCLGEACSSRVLGTTTTPLYRRTSLRLRNLRTA